MRNSRVSVGSAQVLVFALASFSGVLRALPDIPQLPDPGLRARYAARIRAYAFPLRCVRLLPGPFHRAMELERKYLLSLDPERLLHNFRINAGLPSSAKPLGGWENPRCEVRGHFTGHYLSACALMYASTGDKRLKERADYMVAELAKCQQALGGGYLSAFPESFIDRVIARKRVWAPWYTLHKILAGLLEVYARCGNKQALEAAEKFAGWIERRVSGLSDEVMQRMLDTEHGGINEALVNLYAATGKEKYLKLSLRFNHHAVIDPAARGEDRLTGLHANTQIPKFIGTARQYEFTGKKELKRASEFFWETVVKERSYVIGGNSNGEHFSPKEHLSEALSPTTAETCNTYNMLKLTRHLFSWYPDRMYADYYERALYNHILASQNPETGMMCYYVPLRSGSRKTYSTPTDSFWCCTGTGIENHAKYGDSIYFHDGGRRLYVNLFIASELNWPQLGLTVRQETNFPQGEESTLTFLCKRPVELELAVRHPLWAGEGFGLAVNGKAVPFRESHGYAVVRRRWKPGDRLLARLPMTVRCEGFRDNPKRVAFLKGPIVLCAEVDPAKEVPLVVGTLEDAPAALQPIAGKPLCFKGAAERFRAFDRPEGCSLVFEPFYKMHGERFYAVYWDVATAEEFKTRRQAYLKEQERRRMLERRTVDRVRIGIEKSERKHNLRGEKTGSGLFGGRRWRHAVGGGWFSYTLEVPEDGRCELMVTYWGSDRGNRVFDILIDGKKIATQRLQDNRPRRFFDVLYPIPAELVSGKKSVTVTFKAHRQAIAGGIFDCRILRKAPREHRSGKH